MTTSPFSTSSLPDESVRPTLRCQRVSVIGMTCSHCERAIEREVVGIAGVRRAVADASAGTVIVESVGPITAGALADAVHEAGYELAA